MLRGRFVTFGSLVHNKELMRSIDCPARSIGYFGLNALDLAIVCIGCEGCTGACPIGGCGTTTIKSKEMFYSTAMNRSTEWIFSQEIPSDITITVGDSSFALHKIPLISKSGYIHKLVSESKEADLSTIDISDIPGGAEAFELAGKFCYGINFEINTSNIAMLRCVAEYHEMTEEYAVGNLVERTKSYLEEVALNSIAGAFAVLRQSENLNPMAENVKLVSQCVDAIAFIACKESQLCSSTINTTDDGTTTQPKDGVDWWVEDLIGLRIDVFEKVLVSMLARGFKQSAFSPMLMLYIQKSLQGLEVFGQVKKKLDAQQEQEKRAVIETIVSLLAPEKNATPVAFLSTLLRSAIYFETKAACCVDLEKRIGSQLEQANLDDILIPSFSISGGTLFDVDTAQRVLSNYLESESSTGEEMERVGKLMENYLAEIASDRNLAVSQFVSVAELVPEQSRVTEDGIYRAVDIYLKAHPALSDLERKKLCALMDCQKLSQEASAHAAQNDRLPVQTTVQVLYNEQKRLRDVVTSTLLDDKNTSFLTKSTNGPFSSNGNQAVPPDELAGLKKENQDLKLELVKMKMRLNELENKDELQADGIKSGADSPLSSTTFSFTDPNKPPLHRNTFINSVSKKIGRQSFRPAC